MPALPNVANVLRVTHQFTVNGDSNAVSRYFIKYDGTAPTNAQLNTFCAAVVTSFGAHLKSLCGPQTESTLVTAEDLTSTSGAIGSATDATFGSRSGEQNASAVCTVIGYLIARRYRGGHPRGYWPFGTALDITASGEWGGAFSTATKTGIDAYFTDILAAPWTSGGPLHHVNVSYFHGFTVVTNPITHRARNVPNLKVTPDVDTITSRVVRLRIGSQRRRNT